jgi:hypothetical protein
MALAAEEVDEGAPNVVPCVRRQGHGHVPVLVVRCLIRLLKNSLSPRLLKKVQMQGGERSEVRGVLATYVAAPRERANAADGPFSAAC